MQGMEFAVQQEAFTGPLGLLLELIESKELLISKVSLAQVTDEYVKRMEAEKVPIEELADFLLVASRLIYIKSRELMPYLMRDEEAEEGIDTLEEQLRLYKEFVEASKKLEERFGQAIMAPRPFVRIRSTEPVFAPPPALTSGMIEEVFRTVLKRLEPFFALQESSMERVKSIEERIEELKSALESRAKIAFSDVVRGARSKMEIVVSFLALLELLRRQTITVSQSEAFGDIELTRSNV
jgi:segregation and condensation protein A